MPPLDPIKVSIKIYGKNIYLLLPFLLSDFFPMAVSQKPLGRCRELMKPKNNLFFILSGSTVSADEIK